MFSNNKWNIKFLYHACCFLISSIYISFLNHPVFARINDKYMINISNILRHIIAGIMLYYQYLIASQYNYLLKRYSCDQCCEKTPKTFHMLLHMHMLLFFSICICISHAGICMWYAHMHLTTLVVMLYFIWFYREEK